MRPHVWKVAICLSAIFALSGCKPDVSPSNASSQVEQPAPSPVAVQATYDGPFGLKMGLSPAEVKVAIPSLEKTDLGPGVYRSNSVPISHPDFEGYTLIFSQRSGLCKITAIGKDIQSGDTGFEVRSAFDDLDKAVTNKYGKGKKFDFSSERYDSPEFWMMHLSHKNRTFEKHWPSTEGGANLPSDLSAIGLSARASDMRTGYLVMSYEFQNISDCVAEGEAEKNKGL